MFLTMAVNGRFHRRIQQFHNQYQQADGYQHGDLDRITPQPEGRRDEDGDQDDFLPKRGFMAPGGSESLGRELRGTQCPQHPGVVWFSHTATITNRLFRREPPQSAMVNLLMIRLFVLLALLPYSIVADETEALLGATAISVESTSHIDAERMAELEQWVRSSAATVTLTYGRFPLDRVRVILKTTAYSPWSSDSAVYFGQTTRRGGGQIELFINPRAPIEDFYEDWTATHEFSHLMHPLLDREDRWITEGFATYYQNVLMARAGRYESDYAWQRLAEGFHRGSNSRPDLSPAESGEAGVRSARYKYYWAGASLALMADIELRQRSDGAESLDTVLAQLRRCCLPARQRWSGKGFFRRLDSFLDDPVFMPLYRRYANEPGFPDANQLLESEALAPIRWEITRQTANLTYAD